MDSPICSSIFRMVSLLLILQKVYYVNFQPIFMFNIYHSLTLLVQLIMSLKEIIRNSCGEEIYKITRKWQRKKIKAVISKNQLIFLEKCLTHNVTPKSFRIKSPIKSQKPNRITEKCRKKLLVLAKNNAKQRLLNYNIEVNDLSQELRSVLSEGCSFRYHRMHNKYVKRGRVC